MNRVPGLLFEKADSADFLLGIKFAGSSCGGHLSLSLIDADHSNGISVIRSLTATPRCLYTGPNISIDNSNSDINRCQMAVHSKDRSCEDAKLDKNRKIV